MSEMYLLFYIAEHAIFYISQVDVCDSIRWSKNIKKATRIEKKVADRLISLYRGMYPGLSCDLAPEVRYG